MITLRLATAQDSAALLEIYRPYVENTSISFETQVPSVEEFRRRVVEFSTVYPYLAAVEDGHILGYAYAHAYHERAAFRWTVETSIYVAEDAHGRGVGRRLYRALLALLEAQGVKHACAVVTIPNEPSLRFHRAMGFSDGGVLPDLGYKLGAWHSVAYLCRTLGDRRDPPAPVVPLHDLDPDLVARLLSGGP